MKLHLLVSGSDQVVDDVRGGRVAAGTAEPLATSQTFDDAAWIVDAAIPVQVEEN